LEGVQICGKTGTVQNPHGDDHSMFIAFAPKEDPQIALSVIVENSGYGSTWAAPIASLMVEKYLNDTITRPYIENRIMNGNLIAKK
jgi:penicillin-binding protein 2